MPEFEAQPDASIVTIGDELLCGDVSNANSEWLSRRLERLGIAVRLVATLPDDRASISRFITWARSVYSIVVVTGGLGVTPDDITRDAIADAFGVERVRILDLASELEAQGGHAAQFADEWSRLPRGSDALAVIRGGAPAFVIENVFVFAGVPAEMHAAFEALGDRLKSGNRRRAWRGSFLTTEDRLMDSLPALVRHHPNVTVGSYPQFGSEDAYVKIVLRAHDADELAASVVDLKRAMREAGIDELRG